MSYLSHLSGNELKARIQSNKQVVERKNLDTEACRSAISSRHFATMGIKQGCRITHKRGKSRVLSHVTRFGEYSSSPTIICRLVLKSGKLGVVAYEVYDRDEPKLEGEGS